MRNCGQSTLSCTHNTGSSRVTRSETRSSTDLQADYLRKHYTPASKVYTPPTYSKYPYEEANTYQEELASHRYQEEEQNESPAYRDLPFSDSHCDREYIIGKPSAPKRKTPRSSPECSVGNCMVHPKAKAHKASPTENKESNIRLGECKMLEGRVDDPLGVGSDLMKELMGYLPGCEVDTIYSMVSMANTSKYLFDRDNLIRVQAKDAVKYLFGKNACLFKRIKDFVRDKDSQKLAPRPTPGINEPHIEITEKALHKSIQLHD